MILIYSQHDTRNIILLITHTDKNKQLNNILKKTSENITCLLYIQLGLEKDPDKAQ